MVSWVYVVLLVGIVVGLVHFGITKWVEGGAAIGNAFSSSLGWGNLHREPTFPNLGLWIALVCFAVLIVYGGVDVFSHFFVLRARH